MDNLQNTINIPNASDKSLRTQQHCHPERTEGSDFKQILRFAQDEICLPNARRHDKPYLWQYYFVKTKRFLAQFFLIFIFQYLTIINLPFSFPPLPIYPPMGIAFVMFYLFGGVAVWGLLISSLLAYLLKGLPWSFVAANTMADIGCSYLGAMLSLRVFSSDIVRPINLSEWSKFFKIVLGITLISSLIREIPWISAHPSTKQLILGYIGFWFADCSAILFLFSFVTSWLSIYLSREKISLQPIKKLELFIMLGGILLILLFLKKFAVIYLLIGMMIASLYWAYRYGFVVGAGLLYAMSTLFLAYFIAHG